MRPHLPAFLFLFLAASAAAAPSSPLPRALQSRITDGVVLAADGRIIDAFDLNVPGAGDLESSARGLVSEYPFWFSGSRPTPELRLIDSRESLTGSHLRFREMIGGVEVLDSEVTFSFDRGSRMREIHNRLHAEGNLLPVARLSSDGAWRVVSARVPDASLVSVAKFAMMRAGKLAPVYRLVVQEKSLEPWEWVIDATDGTVLRRVALFFNVAAQVFDPNPVTTLNAPALRDENDAAAAVPPSAYSIVDLPDLPASGPLSGPNVRIRELETPATVPVDVSAPLIFQRDTDSFEEVMAYYHLDRSQRYLQSLGFAGTRRIIATPIEVDVHAASGEDNSFFVSTGPGTGRLYFGDGGVDDAEDADILLHEYGHAMQDSIAPGIFFGGFSSQVRAMGEGFGDYWAFSSSYEASLRSGRDPFCIGDWDARCGSGPSTSCGYPAAADCLRRVDSAKTMDSYSNSEQRGTEHRNGEIWSSALRRLFVSLVERHGIVQGRVMADKLILEATFGLPSSPTFNLAGRRIVEADRLLNGGTSASLICSALVLGKIFNAVDCESTRHGEITLFQSAQQNILIPDADPQGIVSSRIVTSSRTIDRIYVQVNIEHPFRGDLRLVLVGPDGTTVVLQEATGSAATDIDAVFGLDTPTVGSLDVFRGRLASGEWRLQVIDQRARDAGRLLSWSLLIDLEGDDPLTVRPAATGGRQHLAVVAKAVGAAGTNFVTDVRIFNRGSSEALFTAVFTRSSADGSTQFSAMRLSVAAGQTVALNDVVASLFASSGTGNIEFIGDVDRLLITSRTYNRVDGATYGQFIPALSSADSVSASDGPLHIPQLQNTAGFRSNLGFSEIYGGSGTVRITLFNENGQAIETLDQTIGRFSHVQTTLLAGSSSRIEDVMRADVRVINGDARIIAYGSVVDNASGDPIYVPAVKQPSFRVMEVPAVLHADGANGTQWRSDLWLTNPSSSSQSVTIIFFSANGSSVTSSPQVVPAASTLLISDAVRALFALESAVGHLRITTTNMIVTSRTWTPGPRGSYGQFIAGRAVEEGAGFDGSPVQSIQIEQSDRFRTNIGFTEAAGNPITVRVRLFDAGGTLALESTHTLLANGQFQSSLPGLGLSQLFNGRATWEVIAGSGRLFAYASVIDNASSDPIYVPAR